MFEITFAVVALDDFDSLSHHESYKPTPRRSMQFRRAMKIRVGFERARIVHSHLIAIVLIVVLGTQTTGHRGSLTIQSETWGGLNVNH